MGMAKLSLIIPCYNSGGHLTKLFASIERQSPKVEAVFVLDPSGDDSESILRGFCEKSGHKLFVNKSRLGVMASRLVGILNSSGEYVAFADADDFLEDDFSKRILEAFESSGADILDFSFYFDRDDGVSKKSFLRLPARKLDKYQAIKSLLGDVYMRGYLWNKAFKREMLLGTPYINIPYFEDTPFLFCCLSRANSIYRFNDALYHYNKQTADDSLTNHPHPERALEHLLAFLSMRHYADILGDERILKAVRGSYLRSYFSLLYDLSVSKKGGLGKEEAKKIKRALKLLKSKTPIPVDDPLYGELLGACIKHEFPTGV